MDLFRKLNDWLAKHSYALADINTSQAFRDSQASKWPRSQRYSSTLQFFCSATSSETKYWTARNGIPENNLFLWHLQAGPAGTALPPGQASIFYEKIGTTIKKWILNTLKVTLGLAASGRDGPAWRIQGLEARRKHHLSRQPKLFHFVANSAFASLECMCPACRSILL